VRSSLLDWSLASRPVSRLFQVLGPDGQLIGYLYTAVAGLQTQVVDAKTVRFYHCETAPLSRP